MPRIKGTAEVASGPPASGCTLSKTFQYADTKYVRLTVRDLINSANNQTLNPIGWTGNGTYTVKYADDVAVSITATGPGSVKTPAGVMSRTGTEQYQLTPLEAGCGN